MVYHTTGYSSPDSFGRTICAVYPSLPCQVDKTDFPFLKLTNFRIFPSLTPST